MNTCGDCQYYGNGPVTGPICTKTKKAVSVLMVKDCFEARTSAPEIVTKVCNRCHRELPINSFSRNHTQKDGYQRQCKQCQSEMSAATYKKNHPAIQAEPVEVPTTKVCAKCGRELPVAMFGHTPKNKSGLKSYCKDCENENCRIYRAKRYGKQTQPDDQIPTVDLAPIPDDALVAELHRRGWRGSIAKKPIFI